MINIVYITDNNYLYNTCISLWSMYENRNANEYYNIYIFTDKYDDKVYRIISDISTNNFKIQYKEIEQDYDIYGMKNYHVSPIACIKFRLPSLLNDIDKVIYFDGDTIIQSDLVDLFNVEVDDYYAAATRDIIVEQFVPSQMKKLKVDLDYYFNSGVMLLNLKKMREAELERKLFDYRKNGINYYMDQDALNVVFGKKVKYLPVKYNYMIVVHNNKADRCNLDEYGYDSEKSEYQRIKDASIIHLAGTRKAWVNYVPYVTYIFLEYYYRSPFKKCVLYKPIDFEMEKNKVAEQYLFPFEHIEKDSYIYIWGMGKVGEAYIEQIEKTSYCRIKAIIDSCADDYIEKKDYKHYKLVKPKDIKVLPNETIVIAVKKESIVKSIVSDIKSLYGNNVNVVWRNPRI